MAEAAPNEGVQDMGRLESALRAGQIYSAGRPGRKLLVPYVTGGLPGWGEVVEAVAASGADAIELGIPFSDPVIDGPVIQAASQQALAAGATPLGILGELAHLDVGDVPLVVMTYYNTVHRHGDARFASSLAEAGVAGAIVPDLPLEEVGDWATAADAVDLATVLLAAPTGSDDRLKRICDRSRGFVYAVGLLGVTGERERVQRSALDIAGRLKAITSKPVLVGVGVSTPEHAREISQVSDGVIVGSALVRRLLDGVGPDGAADFVVALRAGLDS